MSRTATQEEFNLLDLLAKRGRKAIYPWHNWLNGETWVATKDEDFTVSVTSFMSGLSNRAARENLTVKYTSPDDKQVFFRFSKKEAIF